MDIETAFKITKFPNKYSFHDIEGGEDMLYFLEDYLINKLDVDCYWSGGGFIKNDNIEANVFNIITSKRIPISFYICDSIKNSYVKNYQRIPNDHEENEHHFFEDKKNYPKYKFGFEQITENPMKRPKISNTLIKVN